MSGQGEFFEEQSGALAAAEITAAIERMTAADKAKAPSAADYAYVAAREAGK